MQVLVLPQVLYTQLQWALAVQVVQVQAQVAQQVHRALLAQIQLLLVKLQLAVVWARKRGQM
jgi:hypothetical protein